MKDNKSFIVSLLLLITCIIFIFNVARRGVPQLVETNLEELPMQIAGYEGEKDTFPENVYKVLDADLHVYRHYYGDNKMKLSLYIGYYGTAKGGRTGHNPYACLPGAGWGILQRETVRAYPSYYPKGVDINFVIANKSGYNNVMLHWYQTAGTKILANGLQQNIDRFLNRLLYNRNDGAYVQVNSFTDNKMISETKKELQEFVDEIMELLPAHWPVEG